MQRAYCTLHVAHCTLHIAHCTLHIAHCNKFFHFLPLSTMDEFCKRLYKILSVEGLTPILDLRDKFIKEVTQAKVQVISSGSWDQGLLVDCGIIDFDLLLVSNTNFDWRSGQVGIRKGIKTLFKEPLVPEDVVFNLDLSTEHFVGWTTGIIQKFAIESKLTVEYSDYGARMCAGKFYFDVLPAVPIKGFDVGHMIAVPDAKNHWRIACPMLLRDLYRKLDPRLVNAMRILKALNKDRVWNFKSCAVTAALFDFKDFKSDNAVHFIAVCRFLVDKFTMTNGCIAGICNETIIEPLVGMNIKAMTLDIESLIKCVTQTKVFATNELGLAYQKRHY